MNRYGRLLGAMPLFALALCADAALASDEAKEKRWEAQIVDSLLVGEAVKLNTGKGEFLGLYAPAEGPQVHGAVLLLHGMGAHPAWPDVIEPLRTRLPEAGWHTLSLQLPILGNDAEEKEYAALLDEVPSRLRAGVDFLKTRGIDRVVIIGHSMGNTMAAYYLAAEADAAIKAVVVVSVGAGIAGAAKADTNGNLARVKLPILDIYGSQDEKVVLQGVKARAPHLAKSNPDYSQRRIDGADHFYHGRENELVSAIPGWLGQRLP